MWPSMRNLILKSARASRGRPATAAGVQHRPPAACSCVMVAIRHAWSDRPWNHTVRQVQRQAAAPGTARISRAARVRPDS